MSQIIIEAEALKAIMADPALERARKRLSFHELRLIIRHVRNATPAEHVVTIDAGAVL